MTKQLPALFLLLFCLQACGRSSSPGNSHDTPSPSPKADPKFRVDPELAEHLEQLVEVCQVQPWGARVTCPNRQDEKVREWFLRTGKGIADVLDTFSAFLATRDEPYQTVAVDALRRLVNNLNPREVPRLDGQLVLRFLEAAESIPNPRLYMALDSSIAALTSMAHREDWFFERLGSRPEVLVRAVPHVMRFSRLRAFGGVRELAQKGDLALTRACLTAVSRMLELTPEEQSVICPWVDNIFTDASLHLWVDAGKIYQRCPLSHLEPWVDFLERELNPSALTPAEVATLGDVLTVLCPPRGSERACIKLESLIERFRKSPEPRDEVRNVIEAFMKKR